MVDKTGSPFRAIQWIILALGLTLAGSLWAQQSRSEQIAERVAPVGDVCVQGDPCAGGESGDSAAGGSAGGQTTGNQTASAQESSFDPESVYQNNCASCHDTGMAGAPTLDDSEEWSSRLEERGSFDVVLQNAIDGLNAMPPRGMCNDCSDDELSQVIEYMMGDVLE